MIDFFLRPALFLIPLYLANSTAAAFPGKLPIDFNLNFWDKKPLLGKGKTFRGATMGIIAGTIGSSIVWVLFGAQTETFIHSYWLAGPAIALGAIVGDIAKSFFKRRLSIESGKPWPLLDQMDFVAGGYLFALPFFFPSFQEVLFVVLFTLACHMIANIAAFKLKLKKVPW